MIPFVRSLRMALLLAVLIAALPAQAQPNDAWPQFGRTAQRSGDNPDATLDFPLTRTTAVRFPAPIYASPAVVGDLVYVQDARGHVACIDAAKNRSVWITSLGGFNNTSSPAVDDGKVFIGSTAGFLAILDAKTGAILQKIPAEGGVTAAPAVANNAVYFSTFAGKLHKIDFAGKAAWTYDGGRISTTEFAVRNHDILFFAGSSNTLLHQLEDQGDQVRVVSKQPAPGQCCPVGGPAFVGDRFAFQSFDSEFGRFYEMTLGEAKSKEIVVGDVHDGRITPAVRDGRIYRGDKCFSANGLKLLWRADPQVLYDGGFHSSPALAKNVQVVGSERGAVYFFGLDGKEAVRKPIWQFKAVGADEPNGAVSSSPAIVDGKVYFGGEDGILYGLGKGPEAALVMLPIEEERKRSSRLTGSEWPTPGGDMGYSFVSTDKEIAPPFAIGWQTRIWSTFKGPMIVADGRVYCGCRQGPLMALDAGTGEILWKVHHPGVESRPAPTFAEGKIFLMRTKNGQGDSPFVGGTSGGPAGEGIWCHDAATGKFLWHQPMPIRYHFNPDGLVVGGGKVFGLQLDTAGAAEIVAFATETGKELWRTPLADLKERVNLKPTSDVRALPKGLRLPPRFSAVLSAGVLCASLSDWGTVALDPKDGKLLWSKSDLAISNRSRIASRNGTVLVCALEGDIGLDAKSGAILWKNPPKNVYAHALSDLFLESKGTKDLHLSGRCWQPILANGVWYSHFPASSNNRMQATADNKVIWSFDFLSNACPTPSPAYGRLYYSPAGEGVVYCFVPAKK